MTSQGCMHACTQYVCINVSIKTLYIAHFTYFTQPLQLGLFNMPKQLQFKMQMQMCDAQSQMQQYVNVPGGMANTRECAHVKMRWALADMQQSGTWISPLAAEHNNG